ncbi:MAG: hypothetical protein JNJ69_14770 [Leptospiraceae bacterium]|nr:hypothetical protein [Leptospiraceae bacterium]
MCNQPQAYAYNKTTELFDPRPRISNAMLNMVDASPMAVIVGQVTNTQKTVRIMNGLRRSNTLIGAVNLMPGEVSRDLVNYTDIAAIYRAFVYMANNLEPDEDMGAIAFSVMIHFGTGVGNGGGQRSGTCRNYSGIGPKRLAGVMNVETGAYLEGIINMFGWRVSTPALVCAFGTTNTGTPQSLPNAYPNAPSPAAASQSFWREEWVKATDPGTGNNRGDGAGQTGATLYTYDVNSAADCAANTYFPETSGGGIWPVTYNPNTDSVIWNGLSTLVGDVPPGIAGVWDVIKGNGIIGWLIGSTGYIGVTPVATGNGVPGTIGCTPGGNNGDQWSCVKPRDSSGANQGIPYYRWGNRCSKQTIISGVDCRASAANCEGATCQGRWSPDKNYGSCRNWSGGISNPPKPGTPTMTKY